MRHFGLIAGSAVCLFASGVVAQTRSSTGSSSSGFGTTSSTRSGFGGQVGNLGSFRSNNSSFGTVNGLRTGASSSQSMGSDAFGSTRVDALSMGRASGNTNQSRNNFNNLRGGQFGNSMGRGGMNNFGMNNFEMNSQMNARQSPVTTQVAFDVPALDAERVTTSARSPLITPAMPGGKGVRIRLEGNVAVLTGTVPSARDAKLAAAVVSLEPGVRTVDNRLVVASGGSDPQ